MRVVLTDGFIKWMKEKERDTVTLSIIKVRGG